MAFLGRPVVLVASPNGQPVVITGVNPGTSVAIQVTSTTAFTVASAVPATYFTVDTQTPAITAGAPVVITANNAASTPALSLTGLVFSGGTATTTKPKVLIETTATTSTAWSTSGTQLGVNASTGFVGNLIDLQLVAVSKFAVDSTGIVKIGNTNAVFATLKADSAGSLITTLLSGANFDINEANWGNVVHIDPSFSGMPLSQFFGRWEVLGNSTAALSVRDLADTTDFFRIDTTTPAALIGGATTIFDATAVSGVSQLKIRSGAGQSGNNIISIRNNADSGTLASVDSVGITNSAQGTATTAGGALGLKLGASGPNIYQGSGAPTVVATKGSLYLRTDGSGINDRHYVASDSVGGWTAVITAT